MPMRMSATERIWEKG